MRGTILKYTIAIFTILTGLALIAMLDHNIHYWAAVTEISFFLFAIGLVIIIPFNDRKNNLKAKPQKVPSNQLNKLKQFGIAIILLIAVIGLEKFGAHLNYKLRNYYLSFDTEQTICYLNGIKRMDIVRGPHEDFYLVDFYIGGSLYSGALPEEYSRKDNKYFQRFSQPQIIGNGISIEKLSGHQAKVLYSKKFPSFFKIIE